MAASVYVEAQGTRIVLGNGLIQRTLDLRDGVLQTIALVSKAADRELRVESDEFRIVLPGGEAVTSRDFRVADWSRRAGAVGGECVCVHLESADHGLEARVEYELWPEACFIRKTVFLKASGAPIRVESLEVERFTCEAEVGLGGRGRWGSQSATIRSRSGASGQCVASAQSVTWWR